MAVYLQPLILLLTAYLAAGTSEQETRLLTDMFRNYNEVSRMTRPSENGSAVIVNFGLAVISVPDMDLTNGFATINGWLRCSWKDHRLTWTPGQYGNVNAMVIPPSKLWIPDIIQYNNLDATADKNVDALTVIDNTGKVLWIPQTVVKVPCQTSPTNRWNCSLTFGSWAYHVNLVDLNFYGSRQGLDLSSFGRLSNGWTVTTGTAVKNVKHYPCCTHPYTDLTFNFELHK